MNSKPTPAITAALSLLTACATGPTTYIILPGPDRTILATHLRGEAIEGTR